MENSIFLFFLDKYYFCDKLLLFNSISNRGFKMIKRLHYVDANSYSDEENYFLDKKFIQRFPLTNFIYEMEDYDWEKDPIGYDLKLDELESELNWLINDLDDFKLSYLQKEYLTDYFNYMRYEFNKNLEEMEENK